MTCHMFRKYVIHKTIRLISIIDRFVVETPHGKYQWTKKKNSLFRFFALDKIAKIKICHMVASENPEVIEGRRRLIVTDVIDSE